MLPTRRQHLLAGKTHTKPLRTGSETPHHIQVRFWLLKRNYRYYIITGATDTERAETGEIHFYSIKCIFNQLSRFSAFARARTLNLDFHASGDCARNETQIKTWGSFTEIYIPVVRFGRRGVLNNRMSVYKWDTPEEPVNLTINKTKP